MVKPEWGIKRICFNCGARYYDLQRDPILCPSCGTEFDPEALLRARRVRSLSSTEKVAAKDPVDDEAVPDLEEADDELVDETEDEIDVEGGDDEADDGLLEDADELDDGDDDIPDPHGAGVEET